MYEFAKQFPLKAASIIVESGRTNSGESLQLEWQQKEDTVTRNENCLLIIRVNKQCSILAVVH